MIFPLINVTVTAILSFPLTEEVFGLNLVDSAQIEGHPVEGKGSQATTFCGTVGFRTVDGKPVPGLDTLNPEATEPPPDGQLK